ncbi:hypothetical protein [Acinetobacter pittii]
MSTTPLSYVARSLLRIARQHLSLRRARRRLLMHLVQEYTAI